jgi:predicted O-methyltransferase YrrM
MTIEDLVKQAVSIEANEWALAVLWGVARLARHDAPRFGEIGFQNGSSALALLIAAREVGGRVYSIDIAPCYEGRARISEEGYSDIFEFIHGDSGAVRFPEPLDVLFIDGDHEYLEVARDYEIHRANVRKGGVIIFHDPISWPGVGKFLDEIKVPYFRLGAGLGMEVVA